jgi:phenylacetate-coenzyme A ligase PaaK-like adenylate-forming protein
MGRYTEVGSEGEELIKEWEKLLPSIDPFPVEQIYGLTSLRVLTGAACSNLGKLDKAEDCIHCALIEWEKISGPSGIDTLAYARNYLSVQRRKA